MQRSYQFLILSRIVLLSLLLIQVALPTNATRADFSTLTWLENATPDRIINVDIQHPQAKDSNHGTPKLPLKTIEQATRIAIRNNRRGFSTKIIIAPGVYREKISMDFELKKNDPFLIFVAKEPGSAIISGSEIWKDWQREKNGQIYVHAWPYRWGLAPYLQLPGWDHLKLKPLALRREMVFVNGKLLTQVLSKTKLVDGTFFVSEGEGKIFINPPRGINLLNALVEVATRPFLLAVVGKENVAIKGLKFQHAASSFSGSALSITNSRNILIENCSFVWNNWGGYNLHAVRNVLTRGNAANYNGVVGSNAYQVRGLFSENDETSFNNWRGKLGNFFGWADAGSKHHRMHNARYIRQKSIGNLTRGFWLDFDNMNVAIDDALWCGNSIEGVFIEASQGPIIIKNSKIYNNKRWGLRSTNSTNVTIENNIIYDNALSQIKINGKFDRLVNNWETKEQYNLKVQNWTLINNSIGSQDALLLDTINWQHFLKSLKDYSNSWQVPRDRKVFKVGSAYIKFSDWQAMTLPDNNSTFSNSTKVEHSHQLSPCS